MLDEQKTMAICDGTLTLDVHGNNSLMTIYDTNTRIGLDLHKDVATHIAIFLLNASMIQKDALEIDFSVIEQDEAEHLQALVQESKRTELEHYVIEANDGNVTLSLLEDTSARVSVKLDDTLYLANAILWGAIKLKECEGY